MKNPTNRSKWLSLGLLAFVLVLAACVRPVPTDDPTPTAAGDVVLTSPPVQPTAVPSALPSPTPETEASPTAVPAEPTAEPTAAPPDGGSGTETTHVVAPGDTLYSISRRYGVSMEEIMAANNLVNPNYLVVGQQLTIPAPGSGGQPPPEGGTVHIVKPGENLFRIGLQYSCTVDQVAQHNGIPYPYTIYPGQQINIPAC